MDYIDFLIKQEDRILNLVDSSKIVINKYDNKVARITFEFDDDVPGRRYFAMKNPVTDKYKILPIVNNHIIIDTNISSYPGLWESILVVVDDQAEIIDNDIDQSKFTYISNSFKKIVVRDNFLNEDDIEEEDEEIFPIINEVIDNLIKAQDKLETASIVAAEAAESAKADKETVIELMKEIDEVNANIEELEEYIIEIKTIKNTVTEYKDEVQSDAEYVDGILEVINSKLKSVEDTAKQVLTYKNSVEQTVDGCVAYVENSKKELLDAYNQYIQNIEAKTNEALGSITDSKEGIINDINSAKNKALTDIKAESQEQQDLIDEKVHDVVLAEVEEVKDEIIDDIVAESEHQQELIDTKGREVLDNINNSSSAPSDEMIGDAIDAYLSKNPIKETDPTVPTWAKQATKPIYTASEVGADPSGTATSTVSTHNVSTEAHNDIRIFLAELREQVTTVLNSDDETLDQMNEVVAYIKANRELIESVTTVKVSVDDIITNLTTNVDNKVLAASQGVVLKQLIDALQTTVNNLPSSIEANIKKYVDELMANQTGVQIITWEADD